MSERCGPARNGVVDLDPDSHFRTIQRPAGGGFELKRAFGRSRSWPQIVHDALVVVEPGKIVIDIVGVYLFVERRITPLWFICRGCTEMPLLHWPNAAFIEEAHNVDVFVLVGHLNERRVVDALSEGKIHP